MAHFNVCHVLFYIRKLIAGKNKAMSYFFSSRITEDFSGKELFPFFVLAVAWIKREDG